MHHATWRSLLLGSSKLEKLLISRYFMKNHACISMAKKFGKDLRPQKVKNTQKMTSLPLFLHTLEYATTDSTFPWNLHLNWVSRTLYMQ